MLNAKYFRGHEFQPSIPRFHSSCETCCYDGVIIFVSGNVHWNIAVLSARPVKVEDVSLLKLLKTIQLSVIQIEVYTPVENYPKVKMSASIFRRILNGEHWCLSSCCRLLSVGFSRKKVRRFIRDKVSVEFRPSSDVVLLPCRTKLRN